MSTPKEVWYRFVNFRHGAGELVLYEYEVTRHTNMGVWIKGSGKSSSDGQAKWVSKFSTKRFAYPTVELAKESFLIRKRRQLGHLAATHDAVVNSIRHADDDNYEIVDPQHCTRKGP